jgi:hypothetical protein
MWNRYRPLFGHMSRSKDDRLKFIERMQTQGKSNVLVGGKRDHVENDSSDGTGNLGEQIYESNRRESSASLEGPPRETEPYSSKFRSNDSEQYSVLYKRLIVRWSKSPSFREDFKKESQEVPHEETNSQRQIHEEQRMAEEWEEQKGTSNENEGKSRLQLIEEQRLAEQENEREHNPFEMETRTRLELLEELRMEERERLQLLTEPEPPQQTPYARCLSEILI